MMNWWGRINAHLLPGLPQAGVLVLVEDSGHWDPWGKKKEMGLPDLRVLSWNSLATAVSLVMQLSFQDKLCSERWVELCLWVSFQLLMVQASLDPVLGI